MIIEDSYLKICNMDILEGSEEINLYICISSFVYIIIRLKSIMYMKDLKRKRG
jgi:hypothetical protein